MANTKISQMVTASTPLTGDEIVPILQSGENRKTTVDEIVALAANTAVLFDPSRNFHICRVSPSAGGFNNLPSSGVDTSLVGGGGTGVQSAAPAGASLLGSMFRVRCTSSAALNNRAGITFGTNSNEGIYRATSGNALGGGFTMGSVFGLPTFKSTQQNFIGMRGAITQPDFTSGASALINIIGVGKDQGDTNLFFMSNDGSGSATKVDTGLTVASIADKVLRLDMSCGPSGSPVTVTLKIVDSNTTVSTTFSTNLPAADTQLIVCHWSETGASNATAVTIEVITSFIMFNSF